MIKHFTQNRDSHWRKNLHKWDTALIHYEADIDVLRWAEKGTSDDMRGKWDPENSKGLLQGRFLKRRFIGESEEQYLERVETSFYFPLYATFADQAAARQISIEYSEQVTRRFSREGAGESMGDITDQDSVAASLWQDVDGEGMNYLTMLQDAALKGILYTEWWAIVQGRPRDADGRPIGTASIVLIDPSSIVRTFYDNGRLVAVLLRQYQDVAGSIQDEEKPEEQYILYETDGYTLYRYEDNGKGKIDVVEEDKRTYGPANNPFYWYDTVESARSKSESGRILPIFKTRLPLRRNASYILAELNNSIFNIASEQNNIERVMCTPLFEFVGTEEEMMDAMQARAKGWNAISSNPEYSRSHSFLSPDIGAAGKRAETLAEVIKNFYPVAFQTFDNSVQGAQMTATEADQLQDRNENSYQNVLATALDEFERGAMWRVEQVHFPGNPEAWGQFSVDRKRDFRRMDKDVALQRKIGLLDSPLSITEEAEKQINQDAYDHYGLPYEEAEVEAVIQNKRATKTQEQDVFSSLRNRRLAA